MLIKIINLYLVVMKIHVPKKQDILNHYGAILHKTLLWLLIHLGLMIQKAEMSKYGIK